MYGIESSLIPPTAQTQNNQSFVRKQKMITMQEFQLSFIIFFLLFCTSNLRAQQEYSGESVFDCNDQGREAPSPSYLYTCNGQSPTCQAFLIYRAQPRYSSVSTIARLLSSNSSELTRINNIPDSSSKLHANKEVIVPVNCSCSGQYYQANTSYVVMVNDTCYEIASTIYQGLSTCNALMGENPYDPNNLIPGQTLIVPVRCACPTSKQAAYGSKYLLTYSIHENDSVPDLSSRFSVSSQDIVFANNFSEQDPLVYTLTTILIPLPMEPLASVTIINHPIHYPPPPAPGDYAVKRSKRGLRLGIGIGAASLLVLCVVISIMFCHPRMRTKQKVEKRTILPKDILDFVAGGDHILKVFDFEELKAATNDFSIERRIEGSVYRGMVRESMVAIKEMSTDVSKEVNILYKLNHFNIISLHGISVGEEKCYLVYEYMENGSLRGWLQDTSRSGLWSWTQRVQIALDVANGLDYLHNFTEFPNVHKNINSGNILLNGNFRAKIANFSFARSSQSRGIGFFVTDKITGTLGYIAPEYSETGLVTPKLDVFAFGVVISEIITGKRAVVLHEGTEKLLSLALISIVEGSNAEVELSDFMEDAIRNKCQISLALAMAKLSVACLKQDPRSRPSMDEVIQVITRILRDSKQWETAYF